VGKSSVAVNIAAALAERGFRVGILDVDIHGPSVPGLLGLKGVLKADGTSGRISPMRYGKNLSVVSIDALLQDKNNALIWRGPKKTAAIRRFISDVDWGDLDFLVIDSPPGTGDEHLTVLKTIQDAQCIVITTPQEISLADVRKALSFLRTVQAPVLGLVENMSALSCPHCGEGITLFGAGGGRALAESAGIPFLAAVPIDSAVVTAADRGIPVVLLEGDNPAKQAFFNMADAVIRAKA
jgi:Mrp family chromosome partitioning ATPase